MDGDAEHVTVSCSWCMLCEAMTASGSSRPAKPRPRNAKPTKAPAETSMARYDWSRARRGHWAGKLRLGDESCSRVLDSDLAEIFPDSASVNEALRALVRASANVKRPATKRRGRHAA